ncbi:hypothetical protein BKA70DRAFT_1235878 [Coprinopsis sp. MPI-PUGE-AT-0042]|nr:hypothetical protein BKA70DRAFT_1235878 [Coprinopsis sp. MPI-PUGE-AT-0042]
MATPSIQDLFIASSWVLLIYDYTCTLSQEAKIARMRTSHPSKWWFGLFLFYVNRYIPIIDTSILFRIRTGENFTLDLCRSMYTSRLFLLLLSSHAAHSIVYLQTCAVWNKNKFVVVGLFILLMAKIIISLILARLQLLKINYITVPKVSGCFLDATHRIAPYIYMTVFLCEAVTVSLTLIKAFEHKRRMQGHSTWLCHLYKTGVMYSAMVLLSALCNTIIPHISSLNQVPLGLLAPLQHALESMLCNRLMFIIADGKFEKAPANTTNQHSEYEMEGPLTTPADTRDSLSPSSGVPVACVSTSTSLYRVDAFQDLEIQYNRT